MRYVFTLDVIRDHYGDLIREGLDLMASVYGSVFILAEDGQDAVDRFLKSHRIKADVVKAEVWDLRQGIDDELSGGKIDTFFTIDPSLAVYAIAKGVTTCLMVYPKVSVAAVRPNSTSWNEIVTEIDRQAGIEIDFNSDLVGD